MSIHVPPEIWREVVGHFDKHDDDDRITLKNLRLTNSTFNDVATPPLFQGHLLSLGCDPDDLLRRVLLLQEISSGEQAPRSLRQSLLYDDPPTFNPDATYDFDEGEEHKKIRKTHVADILKHVTGLLFIPEVIVPKQYQKKTTWVDIDGATGDFCNVTADSEDLRKAMADVGLRFVKKAAEFVDLLPDGGEGITTLDVRVHYDADNFEAVEEYFCKTLSLFFYHICSTIAIEGGKRNEIMKQAGRNMFGNRTLPNARKLKFTTEEFDAPNYFIVPPGELLFHMDQYFHEYPVQLHRFYVEDAHYNGIEFEMFPQVRDVEFAYLIDEKNKSSSRWEHSSSAYAERSYMTRLIRRPETLSFAAKGCWMNVPDISKNFSFEHLTMLILSEMVFITSPFCKSFLENVSGTLRHLELHKVEVVIRRSAIIGFHTKSEEDHWGSLFTYLAENMNALTTIDFSELYYHDLFFATTEDTSFWRESEDVPLIIPDSGGRKRPLFSPFDVDFKGLVAVRDVVKQRRLQRGMKDHPFITLCEKGDALLKTPIRGPKYLRLIGELPPQPPVLPTTVIANP